MGTPTFMIRPARSMLAQDSGGAPSATIQDFPGMGLDIDQATPIITILVPAFPPADPLLVPAGPAPVLHLLRMRRHECSKEGVRRSEWPITGCLLTPSQSLC
jgi:hypothetical protein